MSVKRRARPVQSPEMVRHGGQAHGRPARCSRARATLSTTSGSPARCMRPSCAARMRMRRFAGSTQSAARALPGVHLVLTYADLPEAAQKPMPLLVPNAAITQLFTPQILVQGRGLLCRRADRDGRRGHAPHRRGRGEPRRNRLRAAAGGVRLPRRDRAIRAARARGNAVEHRGAHSVQPRRQRRGVRQGGARLQGVAAHPSRRAVLHGVPRARRASTTPSSTRSRSTSRRRARTASSAR